MRDARFCRGAKEKRGQVNTKAINPGRVIVIVSTMNVKEPVRYHVSEKKGVREGGMKIKIRKILTTMYILMIPVYERVTGRHRATD